MPNGKPMEIEIDKEKGMGVYSNFVMITHSPSEFVLDFARIMPGLPKAKVVARVIMAPQHVKMFLKALEDNIRKYEEHFGEIKIQQAGDDKKIGFHG